MTSQQHVSAPRTRTNVLAVLGTAAVAVGGSLAFAIWYSSFALYMHVEDLDLGLDEATTYAITRITPTERGLVIIGGALVIVGLIAIAAATVRSLAARRRSTRRS